MNFLLRQFLRLSVITITATNIVTANLLVNGDFSNWESPRQPSGWIVEDTTKAKIEQESGTIHSSPYSCKITRLVTGTGNNYGLRQYVNIIPANVYTFRAWFYDDDVNARGGLLITWCRQDTSAIRSTSVVYTDSAVHTWQQLSKTDTAPDSAVFARCLLRIYGFTGGPAGGVIYIDDAEFVAGSGGLNEAHGNIPLQYSISALPAGSKYHTIRLQLDAPAYTILTIFDLTGRQQKKLFSGELPAGINLFTVETNELTSGVAFAIARCSGRPPLVTKLVTNQ
ncbi:MAG: hypothetical protein ABIK54_03605 [candidate division WOR-3 bacterium]